MSRPPTIGTIIPESRGEKSGELRGFDYKFLSTAICANKCNLVQVDASGPVTGEEEGGPGGCTSVKALDP